MDFFQSKMFKELFVHVSLHFGYPGQADAKKSLSFLQLDGHKKLIEAQELELLELLVFIREKRHEGLLLELQDSVLVKVGHVHIV